MPCPCTGHFYFGGSQTIVVFWSRATKLPLWACLIAILSQTSGQKKTQSLPDWVNIEL